jgi:hypothetical protein
LARTSRRISTGAKNIEISEGCTYKGLVVAMLWFVCFFNYVDVEPIVKCHSRLYDLRVKDLWQRVNQTLNVEVARGPIDPPAVLRRADQINRLKFTA